MTCWIESGQYLPVHSSAQSRLLLLSPSFLLLSVLLKVLLPVLTPLLLLLFPSLFHSFRLPSTCLLQDPAAGLLEELLSSKRDMSRQRGQSQLPAVATVEPDTDGTEDGKEADPGAGEATCCQRSTTTFTAPCGQLDAHDWEERGEETNFG